MRTLDQYTDRAVDQVCLYLTERETRILAGYLRRLIESTDSCNFHLESESLVQEITVTVVRDHQLNEFDERSRLLWTTGK